MTLTALAALLGLVGCLFLIAAVTHFRHRHIAGGVLRGVSSLVMFLLGACVFLLSANLRSYERLTAEQAAGEIQFARVSAHQFNGVLTYPSGKAEYFPLKGDEWQIDARILKWRPVANLMGFDTLYRLERISGRYSQIEDERKLEHTVYPLNLESWIDLWDVVHRYHSWLPWFDAMYGSATYLPMADGALYEIRVSQSGLVARPLNQAARDAVGGWH